MWLYINHRNVAVVQSLPHSHLSTYNRTRLQKGQQYTWVKSPGTNKIKMQSTSRSSNNSMKVLYGAKRAHLSTGILQNITTHHPCSPTCQQVLSLCLFSVKPDIFYPLRCLLCSSLKLYVDAFLIFATHVSSRSFENQIFKLHNQYRNCVIRNITQHCSTTVCKRSKHAWNDQRSSSTGRQQSLVENA